MGVLVFPRFSSDINKQILLDTEKNFSNAKGYEDTLGQFYDGGLLLQDFDQHKSQRRMFSLICREKV